MKSLNHSYLVLLSFFIFFPICKTNAQITGGLNETTKTGLGGNNYIVGTVFTPQGSPINTRMRIRLASQTAGEYITNTDDRGQFIFSGLAAGTYTVSIEGERDYQSVSQQIEVIQTRGAQTYSASIRLVESTKSNPKPGVVDSANLAIPKKALSYYKKSISLSKDGKSNEAIEQLKLAIKEYADFTMAYNEIGVQYLILNELEKAEEALKTAVKIAPQAFEPAINYGIVLFRLKKYSESETVLDNVLKLKDSAVGFYYLGRTQSALEKYEESEKALLSAIKTGNGEMKEAHRMLANVYINTGDKEKAIEQLTIYLKLVPNPPDVQRLKEVLERLKT